MKFRDHFKGRELVFIAEIGINHNGDIAQAKSLAEAAAGAGAQAVKLQTFVPELMYSAYTSSLLSRGKEGDRDLSQVEFFRKLTLGAEEYRELARFCREKGIVLFSTPFDAVSIGLLEEIQVPFYKIASSEVTNTSLLREIARTGKPALMSTGICTEKEIGEAVGTLVKHGTPDIVLMHCVSLYPLPPERVNLNRIAVLREKFGLEVGFSDHSPDSRAVELAVPLGGRIFEKHFMLSPDSECPDRAVSLDPAAFRGMIAAAESALAMLGDGHIDFDFYEKDVAKSARRSLYAKRFIPRGTVVTADDIVPRRPGTGISASRIDEFIGRTALVDIEEDYQLRMEYFE
jgi:sialic acid synthase SpsE